MSVYWRVIDDVLYLSGSSTYGEEYPGFFINYEPEGWTDHHPWNDDITAVVAIDNLKMPGNLCSMFKNCTKLTSIDLNKFDFGDAVVYSTQAMFSGCTNLETVDISEWSIENARAVTNASYMFYRCTSLKEVKGAGPKLACMGQNLVYGDDMFAECTSLKEIDLSDWWGFSNPVYLDNMFYNCTSLEKVYLNNLNAKNLRGIDGMFYNCTNLSLIVAGQWTDQFECLYDGGNLMFYEDYLLPGFSNVNTGSSKCHSCVDDHPTKGYFMAPGWYKINYGEIELNDNNYNIKINDTSTGQVFRNRQQYWKG